MTDDPSRNRDKPLVDLLNEIESLRAENARLRDLLRERADLEDTPSSLSAVRAPVPHQTLFGDDGPSLPAVHARSSSAEKIALFRALFAGRDDVYALRWENQRTGKAGWSPAVVGGPANAKRPDREYLPLTDAVIESHLSGRTHVGLYPLLPDDSCRLLACDFDGPGPLPSMAYRERTIDAELTASLHAAGAVLIEGPRACGKTETARQAARSEVLLDGDTPRLIDEQEIVDGIWDHVRHAAGRRLRDPDRRIGIVTSKR